MSSPPSLSPSCCQYLLLLCGERGYRIERPGSREERVGGEYFYCPHCGSELHADVNAARNIIEVQQPSAVAGRTGT
ncbi:MAG: zinc ribbon domain-containing protein [Candidatus Thorarchaeota archaeon]